jgi:hypothetical protein
MVCTPLARIRFLWYTIYDINLHKFSNMAESPKENLVDLVAGMPKENSILSCEDTSGENLKHKLDRGDSADYCIGHKRVQFLTQPSLDQREDKMSVILLMIFLAPIPTAMQSILTKVMVLLTLLFPKTAPDSPTMEGRTCLNTLSLSLPVIAVDSSPVECHSRANSFSMKVQKNIKTGTGRTLISLNFSHQKMCVW